jgi:amidase/6-aminohexanoate-cyclic-dimer hydrolase
MDDYEALDGLGLAERVAAGDVTAEELLEAAITRIESRDASIGAVVIRMFEEARASVSEGLPPGPFKGVPFLLKDLHLAWPGVPLTNGSKFFEEAVPSLESELVTRYRKAGLVVLGKSHSPEFGLTTTSESKVFGQTHNPWNTDHTAGGSSGGASAAVSAGYVPLANASDGGGSIRIPASCCGLFGMKPTRGRTPVGPHVGEGWSGMSAIHAVTRSVRDSAALLDATAGPDAGAPYAAQPPTRPFLAEVGVSPGRLRIAVQRQAWNGLEPHADCLAALRDSEALCRELGHEVEEAPFDANPSALGPAVLTIVGTSTRFALEARAEELGRPLEEGDVEAGTWALASFGNGRTSTDYFAALRTIHATGRALARHMESYDVVLSPTMATPPLPLGILSLSNPDRGEQARATLQSVGYTQLANAAGNPAMSVPLSWNDEGLPVGIQFMGRMNDEATLYRLAGQLEKAQPWFDRRPPLA